jgi:hypothetical protein
MNEFVADGNRLPEYHRQLTFVLDRQGSAVKGGSFPSMPLNARSNPLISGLIVITTDKKKKDAGGDLIFSKKVCPALLRHTPSESCSLRLALRLQIASTIQKWNNKQQELKGGEVEEPSNVHSSLICCADLWLTAAILATGNAIAILC